MTIMKMRVLDLNMLVNSINNGHMIVFFDINKNINVIYYTKQRIIKKLSQLNP